MEYHQPAFFSSSERVFQSCFCRTSSWRWTSSCSSLDRASHCASTLDSGITLAERTRDVVDAADAAGACVESRKSCCSVPLGRTNRRDCIVYRYHVESGGNSRQERGGYTRIFQLRTDLETLRPRLNSLAPSTDRFKRFARDAVYFGAQWRETYAFVDEALQ